MRLRRRARATGAGIDVALPTASPTPEESERMLFPSRRLDDATLDDTPGTTPAFVGHVDEPADAEVSTRGRPVIRVRGWLISTTGRAPKLTVRLGDGEPVMLGCDRARPEVVIALAGHFGDVPETCGFDAHLMLPEDAPATTVLSLDVDDGEVATGRRFRIVRTSELVPPRADYKTTWDAEAADLDSAKNAVSGYTDDAEYERTALELVTLFDRVVGVHPSDTFLEIGCGVGRVAPALAPKVARWIGCDVSAKMLDHARQRLQHLPNVELVELNGWDLAPIPSESIDVVYCTVVFMHLDEWERFGYIREAMRVLRPGGRIYIDNFNLCSDPGWAFFMEMAQSYHPLGRPPNISKSSTPDELRTYLERAEFGDVRVGASGGGLFVFAHARKAGG